MKQRSKFDVTRRRRRMSCCILPGLLATLGCTSEVLDASDSGGDGAESVATTQAAASACAATPHNIPGSYNITEDQICFATRIINFGGLINTPYDIDLIISHANGYWSGTGQGEMTCVPQSCFFSDGGNQDVRSLSGMFQTTAVAKAGQGWVTTHTSMWLADAMAFMSTYHYSVSRTTSGAGSVDGDNFNPSSLHLLFAAANGSNGINGPADAIVTTLGYSFFVGIPHSGHRVAGTTYTVHTSGSVKMIPATSGICAISDLSGVPPGHQIVITVKNSFWYISSNSIGTGEATCYLFDQSQN